MFVMLCILNFQAYFTFTVHIFTMNAKHPSVFKLEYITYL